MTLEISQVMCFGKSLSRNDFLEKLQKICVWKL